ncbi:MAG: alpha/beta fold hydrolase [Planctomycetaceae bacterium]|nr:alpha/beta fold hydrolase [Planctomycetaceae bacterium]MCA9046705.1 alpha/beta fold hydrolase [Planctomycetaceae bacterium]MCB9949757.1 alpha/beta fold hydrolase [Planctomycetaceae bacterium]
MKIPADLTAEYPFEPKRFDVGGAEMSYVDEGSGPVILFSHGNPTWSFAWRKFLSAFSPNYRVIAVDHIGMGLSDKPADYSYTLENHISNLGRLIEHLDLQNVTLVGHDWGGCIGMGAAGRQPQRFRQFVMMNTAAFRSQRIPFRIALCRIPFLGALGVRGMNLFAGAAVSMAVENSKVITPTVRRGYLLPYDSWANRIAVHQFVLDIPLSESHVSYKTLVGVEEGLQQFQDRRMLVCWGEKDWCFTTAFLDEWEQRFPNAETFRLPNVGHYLFEDAPQEVIARMREWLNNG